MDKNPQANLAELIREYQVVSHKKRQEFFSDLVFGLIHARSVIFSELAAHLDRDCLEISTERRIQDFFQKVNFNYLNLLQLLLSLIPRSKFGLSIDRTEWDRGKHQYNILCIVASIGKIGVPLYFELLDNNSGNSHTNDRIRVIEQVLKCLSSDRIQWLVMDREFIGHIWLKWLKEQGIPFVVRVPKSHNIMLADGTTYKAEQLYEQGVRSLKQVIVDGVIVELSLSINAKKELLFLIGTEAQLKATYRKRWAIETFFQALKGRGFKIEQTALRSDQKLRKLFAIAALAYTICWSYEMSQAKQKPVKPKKHGYPQYSLFRRGLNKVRVALKKRQFDIFNRLWTNARFNFDNFNPKTVG